MQNTKIYVATHKLVQAPKEEIYVPIVAGAYQNHLPYLEDNTGNNISYKNPYYSELTALYWIWKQDKSDIVGFVHYHRYFFDKHFIKKEEVENLLKKYDIVLPVPMELNTTIYRQYERVHYGKDLKLACSEIIKRDYKYRSSIEEVLNQNYLYFGNICIASKKLLDDYFSFLFSILFALEKQIPYFNYPTYQKRVFGFLAERILNLYVVRHNLYVKEYKLIDTNTEKILVRKLKDISTIQ